MPNRLRLLLAAACLLPSPGALLASGTYPPAPPRLRADVLARIDAEQYNLGKAIFTQRFNLADTPQGDADAQAARRETLVALQTRLPERARESIDLPALAPRLTDTQASAVIYYAKRRFSLSDDNA